MHRPEANKQPQHSFAWQPRSAVAGKKMRAVLHNRIEADLYESNAQELPLMVLLLLGPSAGKMPVI